MPNNINKKLIHLSLSFCSNEQNIFSNTFIAMFSVFINQIKPMVKVRAAKFKDAKTQMIFPGVLLMLTLRAG